MYGEADQVIYDGGVIKNQKQNAEANEVIQQQSLEAQLYTVYDRVNQLFFGTILVSEQLKQNDLLWQDIQNGINKLKAQVANGIAYRSSADELSAQLLQAEQTRAELVAARKAYLTCSACSPVKAVCEYLSTLLREFNLHWLTAFKQAGLPKRWRKSDSICWMRCPASMTAACS